MNCKIYFVIGLAIAATCCSCSNSSPPDSTASVNPVMNGDEQELHAKNKGGVIVGQQLGKAPEILDLSDLPDRIVTEKNKLTIFADWQSIGVFEPGPNYLPEHLIPVYIVNQTSEPISINRGSSLIDNCTLEYKNKQGEWQSVDQAEPVLLPFCGMDWHRRTEIPPGQCHFETFTVQKTGEIHTVRLVQAVKGQRIHSTAHAIKVHWPFSK